VDFSTGRKLDKHFLTEDVFLGSGVSVELLSCFIEDNHIVGHLLLDHDVPSWGGLEAKELLLVVAVVCEYLVDLIVLGILLEYVQPLASGVEFGAVIVDSEFLE
jgi:hypothetical protein